MLGSTKVVMKYALKHVINEKKLFNYLSEICKLKSTCLTFKIPILGWSWSMAEYIFIKRIWESDSKVLTKDLNTICDYPKELFYAVILLNLNFMLLKNNFNLH